MAASAWRNSPSERGDLQWKSSARTSISISCGAQGGSRSPVVWLLVAASPAAVRGLNFGIDFTGGTLIEVGYQQDVELDSVRSTLADGGFVVRPYSVRDPA